MPQLFEINGRVYQRVTAGQSGDPTPSLERCASSGKKYARKTQK